MYDDMISVIIPVYNVENFLEKCIESVLEQSYKNLEIILVDDGSTDKSGKICDEYKMTDNRIKVIHKANGGLSDARNTGLKTARGKYYSFIDSDDYIASEMLQIMIDSIKRNHCEIAVCNMIRFLENGDHFVFYHPVDTEQILSGEERFLTMNQPSVCNKLFDSELFNNIKFPKGKYYEDTYIYHELLYQAKRVVLTGKASYWYRARPDSIVGRKQYTNQYFDFIEAIYYRARFLESKNVQPYWIEACLSLYAAYANAEKNIEKSEDTRINFNQSRKKFIWAYNKIIKREMNIGMKQRIRLILLRYFPAIHSKIY